jgi:SAM-dependent methyltransferase
MTKISSNHENEVENVNCDNCGSHNFKIAYELTDELYNIPGVFIMRKCQECGLLYLSPRPTRQGIIKYYPPNYSSYRPPIEDERFALMRWVRRRKLIKRRELIQTYSQKEIGSILDVGSATGLFLNEMKKNGWQCCGIEPIGSAADFSRERFNLEVFSGMLEEAQFSDGSFDVMTFWDVLEHTFSPMHQLSIAYDLLGSDGLLAFSIPNWNSYERQWFDKNWQGLDPPRHLYVFPHEPLIQMLDRSGFRILDWVCFMPSYYSFIISLERWLRTYNKRLASLANRILNFPGMRIIFEPWFAWSNHIKKGSVITVFARKTTVDGGNH